MIRILFLLFLLAIAFSVGVAVGRRSARRELPRGRGEGHPIIDVTPEEIDEDVRRR